AAVAHAFGFAARRSNGSAIQMIASDHDRRTDFAFLHKMVDAFTEFGAFAITEPANSRRQSLECNAIGCETNPARKTFVFWKRFQDGAIGAMNIFWIAGQCDPAKWSLPFTEQRADVGNYETWKIKCIRHAVLVRLSAKVVPVIKNDCAPFLHIQHC